MAVNTDPQWYQNMLAANAVNHDIVTSPDGPYIIRGQGDTHPNTVTFQCGEDEMLKFSDKGFWVRGVKVEQDEREAQAVYEGFTAWLAWQQLNGYNT